MVDLRVLIVADDPLARTGLAALVAGEPGCQVTGQIASTGDLAMADQTYRPDVVLWDLGWNPEPGLAALAGGIPFAAPLVLLLADEAYAAEAWSAGALGLLRRDVEPQRLASALGAAASDLAVVDPSLIAALAPPRADDPAAPTPGRRDRLAPAEELTQRELDVLRLMAEGLPNKGIALRLGISEHTVKFHVNAILGKLGVSGRTEAVVQATRLGLILL